MALHPSRHGTLFLDSNVTARLPTIPEPLTDAGFITIGVYLTILGFFAFVGNLTVMLVLLLHQKTALRKLQNVLLLNMAFADLLVSISSYPMTAVSSFHKRWLFGAFTCKFGGFLVFMLTMVSMDTLVFIAIFRYILICRPKYHHLLKTGTARSVITVTWLHAAVWTALPLLGWGRYVPELFHTSCTIDWVSPSRGGVSYVVMTILTCYVLHVVVVIYCYSRIMHASRKLTFGTRKNSTLVKLEEVLWHHKIETEKGVTKMCAVMVAAFLVCWTPYTVISLLAMFGVPLTAEITTLPTMFAKLSCAVNPVVYAFLSSKFRALVRSHNPWAQRNQNRVAIGTVGEEPKSFHALLCSLNPRRAQRNQNRVATGTVVEEPKSFRALLCSLNPCRAQRNQNRVATVVEEPKSAGRQAVTLREYRGDMTNQGVYIGNMAVSLEVQSTIF